MAWVDRVPQKMCMTYRPILPPCLSAYIHSDPGSTVSCVPHPFCFSPMPSKRGRKRNDNLPPSRARENQRNYRSLCRLQLEVCFFPLAYWLWVVNYLPLTRIFHLSQKLEERVDILERENHHLRRLLNFPYSTRPALGRGPTGRDRPMNHERINPNDQICIPSRDSLNMGTARTIDVSVASVASLRVYGTCSSRENGNPLQEHHHLDGRLRTNSSYHSLTVASSSLKPSHPPYLDLLTTSSSQNSFSQNSTFNDVHITSTMHSNFSDRLLPHNYSEQDPRCRNHLSKSHTPSPFEAQHHGDLNCQRPSSPAAQFRHQPPQHLTDPPVSYALAPRRQDVTDSHRFHMPQNCHTSLELSEIQDHRSPPIRYSGLTQNQDDVSSTPSLVNYSYWSDSFNHHPIP